VAQRQAALVELDDDLVERLLAEVRDGQQTVLTWARLRQLRGRSDRSRSSIGRSRSGEPTVVAPISPSSRPCGASLMSATRLSSERSVSPAEASASRGAIEPSVSMSRIRRSKFVDCSTRVGSTSNVTRRTGE
jgi:hypothetical protein